MDISTIVSLIGSLGFPIVCCGVCFYFINTTMKEFQKTMQDNTKMIEKLIAKINTIEKK